MRIPRRLKKRLVKEFRRTAVALQVERPRISAAIDAQWVVGQDNSGTVARVRRTHVPLRRNESQRRVRSTAHACALWSVAPPASLSGLSLILPGSKPSGWRAAYPWGLPRNKRIRETQWHRERLAVMEAQAKREEMARGESLKSFIRAHVRGDLLDTPAYAAYREALQR